MSGELELLTELYLDGSANADQLARLEELLQSDPSARAAFLLSSAQVVSLRDLSRLAEQEASETRRGRTVAGSLGFGRKMVLATVALAACVTLSTAAYFLFVPVGRLPTLTTTGSGVELERNHQRVQVAQHATLSDNDVIHVGDPAVVNLAYEDGTLLQIAPNSTLIVRAETGTTGKRLRLERGELSAKVTKQPKGLPLAIQTPTTLVQVVGTEFQLRVQEGSTRLNVREGAVKIQRTEDKGEVLVAKGEQVFVAAGASGKLVATKVEAVSTIEENFEEDELSSRGWYDAVAPFYSKQEHVQGSRRSVEFRFPNGASAPTSGAALRRRFSEADAVLIGYWSKWGSNAASVPSHTDVRLMTNRDGDWQGPGTSHLTVTIGGWEGRPSVWIQDSLNINEEEVGTNLVGISEARAVAGGNGDSDGYGEGACNLRQDSGATRYANWKGWSSEQSLLRAPAKNPAMEGWHHMVVYIRLNSIVNGKGVADGQIKLWCDGTLAMNHDKIFFRTGANAGMKFNQFLIAPSAQGGIPLDQFLWLDNITVMPGPLPAGWAPPAEK